jgi:uncharacterized membrane protein YkoI
MTPLRKITIGLTALGSVAVGALGISTIGTANAAPASSAAVVAVTADSTVPVAAADSGAATSDATTSPADATTPPADAGQGHGGAPSGPHTANGITETVLTGDTATSVEAAVKAAYPDATIDRMETDAEGAVYEAHITKADGSDATVKLDANFAVTGTVTGHG